MLDKGLLQRIVGALVLVALAVIFVPMLFNREDAGREVAVDAPRMPEAPVAPDIEPEPVDVPEPAPDDFEIIEEGSVGEESLPAVGEPERPSAPIADAPEAAPSSGPAPAPSQPVTAPVETAPSPVQPAKPAPKSAEEQRLDASGLPVSWSVQLASLSSRENAEKLQSTLRSQGYNAYVRTADGMNRVFVGPLVERAEANRLRDQLQRQQKLDGFVVRFKPEQQ